MKNIEQENKDNLRECPSFPSCSQNLCPLDLELNLRNGKDRDKCRWMREPKKKKIRSREFISGGSVMPDGVLNFVPQGNLKWLNENSQKRWLELKNLNNC